MIDSMKPSKRREAYLRTKEAAINCFPADLHSKAHAFFNSQHIIPEAFYYTHLGRADLVQFDVILEKMVSDDPRAKSLYEDIVQHNCL